MFEAVMLSIENLNEYHKKLYKQLAVFLDDVGIPPKVRTPTYLSGKLVEIYKSPL